MKENNKQYVGILFVRGSTLSFAMMLPDTDSYNGLVLSSLDLSLLVQRENKIFHTQHVALTP